MSRYAIVGFGCAGCYAARTLRQRAPESEIDVYTDAVEGPSNPMLTTYYVAGKIRREEQFPLGDQRELARELGLNLFAGTPVRRVWAAERTVELADGRRSRYDDIVLATGAHPLAPPIPGKPEENVYVMRTPADADALLARIEAGLSSALVIGASWVGIKVAEALYAHQVPTVMADMAPRIFPTATLPETAEVIHRHLEGLNIGLKFGCGIQAMRQEADGVVSVFQDGSEVKAEIVALCLGVRSTVGYLDPAEIELGRAIRVNRRMETSVPHIYAAGDCCETDELVTGQNMAVNLWANAVQQGIIAARNITGAREEYGGNLIHNVTHFLHMDFIGLGDNRAQGEHLTYCAPEGWRLELICRGCVPLCVNILDNQSLSGPVKAVLLKRLQDPEGRLDVEALSTLRSAGLPEEIVRKLEGGSHVHP